jgi:hypothetical protein
MSATQQEQLGTPTEPTEPEKDKDKGASTREYIVLEFRGAQSGWAEVKRVTASDALSALGEDLKPTAKYVAVAERYWRPATPKIETTTTVSLSFD